MPGLPLMCTKLIPSKYFIAILEHGMSLTAKLELQNYTNILLMNHPFIEKYGCMVNNTVLFSLYFTEILLNMIIIYLNFNLLLRAVIFVVNSQTVDTINWNPIPSPLICLENTFIFYEQNLPFSLVFSMHWI